MTKKNMKKDVGEMSVNEMNQQLLAFKNSKYWAAYRMFVEIRMAFAGNSLLTIDPFKDPTSMAKNQGIRIGVNDLDAHLITFEAKLKEEEEKENQEVR